ncbi:MAG TPA: Rieske 2Fe-2S domain-containing protein [Acidimicrobiales bacterium]
MEYEVCRASVLPSDRGWPVRAAGRNLAVFRTADGVFAVDNVCNHVGFPIDDGAVSDGCVTCPWHGWVYELASGSQVLHSLTEDGLPLWQRPGLRTYPVRIVGGAVIVEVDAVR